MKYGEIEDKDVAQMIVQIYNIVKAVWNTFFSILLLLEYPDSDEWTAGNEVLHVHAFANSSWWRAESSTKTFPIP